MTRTHGYRIEDGLGTCNGCGKRFQLWGNGTLAFREHQAVCPTPQKRADPHDGQVFRSGHWVDR